METVILAKGTEDSGLCLLLKGVLEEGAARHGGRLPGLGSRIGIDAPDAGATATLVFTGGRCIIEEGLKAPDLVLRAGSDILPQVTELPLRYGLPWFISEPGRRLVIAALRGDVQLRGLHRVVTSPLRTARAAIDLFLLLRLLAGGAS
jgi:hypothetical protein